MEFINKETGELVDVVSYVSAEQLEAYKKQQQKDALRKNGKKAKAFTFSDMENAKEVI